MVHFLNMCLRLLALTVLSNNRYTYLQTPYSQMLTITNSCYMLIRLIIKICGQIAGGPTRALGDTKLNYTNDT